MLKAFGIFIRLVCSLVILLAVALYLQMPQAVAPDAFADGITPEAMKNFCLSLNWVSITAGALVLCALLRLLDLAWNVAFCLSIVLVAFCGLWAVWGPVVALPTALQGNACMTQLCTLPQDYPVPALIVLGVFTLGWLAATAPFRIAFTTAVSFGLWYGVTSLMYWGIVTHWAETPTPAQPELLAMVLANPWMVAALPGAFFLVYAVLAAFFETFLSSSRRKKAAAEKTAEEKAEPAPAPKVVLKPMAPQPEAKPDAPKASAQVAPKMPAPKAETAPAAKPEEKPQPREEAKPAEPAPATPTAEKAEAKPAEPAKPATTEAPAEEEKNAAHAEPAPAEKSAPKAEEKPAEEKPAEKA